MDNGCTYFDDPGSRSEDDDESPTIPPKNGVASGPSYRGDTLVFVSSRRQAVNTNDDTEVRSTGGCGGRIERYRKTISRIAGDDEFPESVESVTDESKCLALGATRNLDESRDAVKNVKFFYYKNG